MFVNRYRVNSPVDIVTTNLGIPKDYRQECINEAYKLGDTMNKETNVKAIMSSYHIWKETNVFNILIDNILKLLPKLIPTYDLDYKIDLDDCWSAIYKKGHYTVSHKHLPSLYSFCYYLQTTSNTPLVFDECNFIVSPKDDMLVVFPASIQHSVPHHNDNQDRILIAGNFNLIPNETT